jgi:methanogenic corrinoid protein MtbC1
VPTDRMITIGLKKELVKSDYMMKAHNATSGNFDLPSVAQTHCLMSTRVMYTGVVILPKTLHNKLYRDKNYHKVVQCCVMEIPLRGKA